MDEQLIGFISSIVAGLVPLSEEKRERIRRQVRMDWSKGFIPNATIEHLDADALRLQEKSIRKR